MSIYNMDYVVISAHQPENDKQTNARLQADLLEDLIDLVGFDAIIIPISGKYNGIEEESFAVIMPDINEVVYDNIQDGLIKLGNDFNQECLLVVFGTLDPPSAALYHLDRSNKSRYFDFDEHPWIEITEEDYNNLSGNEGVTKILNKYFIMDENIILN